MMYVTSKMMDVMNPSQIFDNLNALVEPSPDTRNGVMDMTNGLGNGMVKCPNLCPRYSAKAELGEYQMAKQHTFSQVSVWLGDTLQVIKNQNIRLRFSLGFTVKHDGDAVSTPHTAMFDMTMPWIRLLELAKNSIAIVIQNKILRPKSSADALKWLREHDPIDYDAAFPGKRSVTIKEMSPSEIKDKCKSDPDFRAKLMAELMAMEDEDLEDDSTDSDDDVEDEDLEEN